MSEKPTRPPVVINLLGPMPPSGHLLCATCATLYLGEVSADPEVQARVQEQTEHAMDAGISEIDFRLPKSWRKLNPAVTIAPSVYFPYPMPVCWVHLQGMRPPGMNDAQNIIKLPLKKDNDS